MGWEALAGKVAVWALGIGAMVLILYMGVKWMLHTQKTASKSEAEARTSKELLDALQRAEARESRARLLTRNRKLAKLRDEATRRDAQGMPRDEQ